MDFLPGGTATFLLLFGLFLAAFAARSALRTAQVLRLIRHGLLAGGRCAQRRTADRGPDTERGYATEYVFAFRTPQGHEVEFTDASPTLSGIGPGAPVRVRYDPSDPARRATVAGPGTWWPLLKPALFTLVLTLFAAGLLLGFAATGGWT
ncbi:MULTISPECIES: DUF3592 domain-containing protein [unclassified Streptomyces]|uniref:DUF3592 domain-containing protein n=1 Tax=unclassified Streptomyces TaxID=2593676 RepID=UPI00094000D6|nr:DUF3592 domain-containing protein [Streptomyces sp. TSRI0281]OKI47831.1 hypothetical protein A6A29_01750 [Streptomyces sp. TSRI0281]